MSDKPRLKVVNPTGGEVVEWPPSAVTLEQLLAVRDELRRRAQPPARCPACGAPVYVACHPHGRTLLPEGRVAFYPFDERACPFCGSLDGRPL